MPLLPFAQLDFAGGLALPDGRYLVRPEGEPGADPDVLALRTLGAERSRARLRRGKPVPLESEPGAEPLQLSRLTLIKAIPFGDEAAAEDWLQRVGSDDELAGGLVAETARTANRALAAHRVAAPDAYAADLDPAAASAARLGYGNGDEVAAGRWSQALELAESRRRSLRAQVVDGVGAQERIAAVLGGRDRIRPDESLLVDAERAAREHRPELALRTLIAGLDALADAGGDPGEAQSICAELRGAGAPAGAAIEPERLREALRAGRRAVRALR